MGQLKLKLCLFVLGAGLLFMLTFGAREAVVAQGRITAYPNPIEDRVRDLEQQVSTNKVRIEEMAAIKDTLDRMAQDTTANRIAIATIQANFSIVYGALTFVGGLVCLQFAQWFMGGIQRKKEKE